MKINTLLGLLISTISYAETNFGVVEVLPRIRPLYDSEEVSKLRASSQSETSEQQASEEKSSEQQSSGPQVEERQVTEQQVTEQQVTEQQVTEQQTAIHLDERQTKKVPTKSVYKPMVHGNSSTLHHSKSTITKAPTIANTPAKTYVAPASKAVKFKSSVVKRRVVRASVVKPEPANDPGSDKPSDQLAGDRRVVKESTFRKTTIIKKSSSGAVAAAPLVVQKATSVKRDRKLYLEANAAFGQSYGKTEAKNEDSTSEFTSGDYMSVSLFAPWPRGRFGLGVEVRSVRVAGTSLEYDTRDTLSAESALLTIRPVGKSNRSSSLLLKAGYSRIKALLLTNDGGGYTLPSAGLEGDLYLLDKAGVSMNAVGSKHLFRDIGLIYGRGSVFWQPSFIRCDLGFEMLDLRSPTNIINKNSIFITLGVRL